MNRCIRCALVPIALLAPASAAQPNPLLLEAQLQLTVRLYDYANVPERTLAKATAETARIYREAGIAAVWVDCSLSLPAGQKDPLCRAPLDPTNLVLRILPESMAKKMKLRGSIFGLAARARHSDGQRVEAVIACNVLNQMTEHGRPVSFAVGR